MFKKFLLALIIPCSVILLTSGSPSTPAWQKENVSFPMMNQEIRHSMQENERQKEMKNKQLSNLSLEKVNETQWKEFKETKQKIQDRLRHVEFALQAIPTGYVVLLETQRIADMQEKIWYEIQTAPYSIAFVLPNQIIFLQEMQMVVRLMIGIVASYGAINQMEKAERKILLDFALGEVKRLRKDTSFMYWKIKDIKRKVAFQKFKLKNYINKDKQIIEEIMSNF